MGCDIHPYIEEKRNGIWVYADTYLLINSQDEEGNIRVDYSSYDRDNGYVPVYRRAKRVAKRCIGYCALL